MYFVFLPRCVLCDNFIMSGCDARALCCIQPNMFRPLFYCPLKVGTFFSFWVSPPPKNTNIKDRSSLHYCVCLLKLQKRASLGAVLTCFLDYHRYVFQLMPCTTNMRTKIVVLTSVWVPFFWHFMAKINCKQLFLYCDTSTFIWGTPSQSYNLRTRLTFMLKIFVII